MRPSAIITGATGYIGSHVTKYLLNRGWDIAIIAQPEFGYGYIEDIRSQIDIFEYNGDIDLLIEYFKRKNADVVMHLAAAVITNYTPEQIPVLIRSNIEFGTQVLEAMKHSSTRLFIGTGSYWQNYNSDTYNPVDLYAATKEAFEKILQYYVDAFDFRAITLRLFDVYGEDDRRPKLWTLLRDIAGTDKSLDISAGEQLLDLVHVDDVARAYECAYEWLVSNPVIRNEIFGVYTGQMKPLKEIVGLYQKILNKKMKLNWGARPYKKREVMKPFSGYAKLPNWQQDITIEIGLTKFNKRGGKNVCFFMPSLDKSIAA